MHFCRFKVPGAIPLTTLRTPTSESQVLSSTNGHSFKQTIHQVQPIAEERVGRQSVTSKQYLRPCHGSILPACHYVMLDPAIP